VKNKFRIIAGIAVSVLCLYLALRGANLAEVISVFRKVNLFYLLPMTMVLISAFVLRAVRWQYLLAPVKFIAVKDLFASTMIGFMANNVLPFRAGEFVRAYSISQRESIGVGSSLASLVIERVYDGLTVSLFLLSLLSFVPLPTWLVNFNYLLLSVYVLCGGAAFVLVWAGKRNRSGWLWQRWQGFFHGITLGLESCANGKQIVWSAVLSLAHWLAIALYYYLLFLACGFSLSFLSAVVLVVVVAIGIMLPAAPGSVGSFQYSTVLGLSLFAIPRAEALGYSLIAHAGQFIPVTLIGLFYFFRQSAGFTELRGVKQRERDLENVQREVTCG
jgi:glycosyltransferase 2 family protein